MTTILVTGSNGQLGNEIRVLASQYNNFSFIYHDIDTLDIADIEQLKKIIQAVNPKYIINCAAYTAVDKAESDVDKAQIINSEAVKNLSIAADLVNAKLIHISTDYVFDGKKYTPYNEEDAVNPISAYGRTKLDGEKQLSGKSNTLIIRTAWLYSIFGNNIAKTILRLGKERDELKFVFDQTGSPTYAADLASAILQIIDKVENGTCKFVPGIYHYSNEGACSWFDFASEIIYLSKLKCKVYPIETQEYPTPATRPPYSVFNKKKIKSTYQISVPWWKDSLVKCLDLLNKQ